MSAVSCPHCGKTRITTSRVPRDVVVMLPCPECHELVVLFRGKAIALNREVLQSGTKEERRNHIAEIVEEFLPPELFSGVMNWDFSEGATPFPFPERRSRRARAADTEEDDEEPPISDAEVERFQKFELHRIDEPRYFKRHFGS
jgi:hypothetical protein